MIILSFKAKAVPESCGELLQALNSMLEDVRDLEGCLSCCCYRSVEDDGDLFFIEQWATQKHLDEHMRSDLYGAIQGAFRVLTEGSRIELIRAEDPIQSGGFSFGER